MDIFPFGSRPTTQAPAKWFTGTVWQDPINQAPDPARVAIVRVSFEPGARTAWHTHPLGQTLHVLSGVGHVCLRGEPAKTIRPGDTVWIPPEQEHWHGASQNNSMTHMAIHECVDGSAAGWLEHVTDDDYSKVA